MYFYSFFILLFPCILLINVVWSVWGPVDYVHIRRQKSKTRADSTFPELRCRAGSHQDLNGKEEEAEGWLRTRVRRHFQRFPLSTSFTGLLLFESFFFRTNRPFMSLSKRNLPLQLFRCARQSARLHVTYFSVGEVGRLPTLNILIVASVFLWVDKDCF